ncbi:MAG: DUF4105 domain-containing protein [Bacteroidales bacterium]|nr:DUF4105 domain-containing protein [Bacteroidales bacterium]MBN2819407.1 DUF4105 domain-containing protein [Bacteroidales bacterium]
MIKKSFWLAFLILQTIAIKAGNFSVDPIRISLLTYTPGTELYSTFGHSAVRVVDYCNNTDYTYNYGTFDFDDEGFYFKFIKGNLKYKLSRIPTEYVILYTQEENRSIVENEFFLPFGLKKEIQQALEQNYLPGNRQYYYDFLYNNCSTRIFDLIDSIAHPAPAKPGKEFESQTFLNLVDPYLSKHSWSKLAINVSAGSEFYKQSDFKSSVFLPDSLQSYLKELVLNDKQTPLVGPDTLLLKMEETHTREYSLAGIMLSVLFLIGLSIRYFEYRIEKRIIAFDYFVFVPVILFSVVLWLVLLISDHEIFRWNFHLLWLNPVWTVFLLPKVKPGKRIRIVLGALLLTAYILSLILYGFYFPLVLLLLILVTRIIKS